MMAPHENSTLSNNAELENESPVSSIKLAVPMDVDIDNFKQLELEDEEPSERHKRKSLWPSLMETNCESDEKLDRPQSLRHGHRRFWNAVVSFSSKFSPSFGSSVYLSLRR